VAVRDTRDSLRPVGTPTTSTVSEALARYSWHSQAACAGREDVFLSDDTLGWTHPESPTVLLGFLICAGCPVRRPCLQEALRTVHVALAEDADPRVQVSSTTAPASGVWAGTTMADRRKVRRLPRGEALERLEREFPERLAGRVAAFQRHEDGRPPEGRAREVRRMLVGIAVRAAERRRNGNGVLADS